MSGSNGHGPDPFDLGDLVGQLDEKLAAARPEYEAALGRAELLREKIRRMEKVRADLAGEPRTKPKPKVGPRPVGETTLARVRKFVEERGGSVLQSEIGTGLDLSSGTLSNSMKALRDEGFVRLVGREQQSLRYVKIETGEV